MRDGFDQEAVARGLEGGFDDLAFRSAAAVEA
jgi:hypothetical protein